MSHKKFIPLVAFFLFGSITVILWQNQNKYERELVFRHTETSSEQIRIRIQGLMNTRMASLEVLADRWVQRIPPDFRRKRFLEFAKHLYTHYPGFMGINWIDPEGVIRWVFPRESNEKRMGLRSMKARVNLLGGQMTIQSCPMQGTKIFIKIPFKKQNNESEKAHINH